jgi:hypothetical protein
MLYMYTPDRMRTKPRSRNPKVERPRQVSSDCVRSWFFSSYTDESEFAFCLVLETSSLCWSFIIKEFRKVCGLCPKFCLNMLSTREKHLRVWLILCPLQIFDWIDFCSWSRGFGGFGFFLGNLVDMWSRCDCVANNRIEIWWTWQETH